MKRIRHTLLLLLLAILLLWPAVQHGLVRTSWIDPAALGAWGSHAAPEAKPLLIIQLLVGDSRERVRLSETPRGVQNAGRGFLRRRAALGKFEEPSELAQSLLSAYDQPTAVEIQVVEDRLNVATAHIERREDVYRYARSDFD